MSTIPATSIAQWSSEVPIIDIGDLEDRGITYSSSVASINTVTNKVIFLEGSEFSGKTSLMKEIVTEYNNKGYNTFGFAFCNHENYRDLKEIFTRYEVSKDISLKEVITAVYKQYFLDISYTIDSITDNSNNNIFVLDQFVWRTFVLQAYLNNSYDDFLEVHNTLGKELSILHAPYFDKHLFVLEARESVVMKRKTERMKAKETDILDEVFTSKLNLVRQGYQTAMQNEKEPLALGTGVKPYCVDSSGSLSYAMYQIGKCLNI